MTWLTVAEAADILRESPITTSRRCKRGDFPATKTGRSWRINRLDLEAFLAPTNTPASQPAPSPAYRSAAQKRLHHRLA